MIDNPLQRLCENPKRWLIVTGVTFVIALLTVLPQVDEVLAARAERSELRDRMEEATRAAETLPSYEGRVRKVLAELRGLREREVREDQVSELRKWLVDAARESGCQVRRIHFAEPKRRQWRVGDHPLAEVKENDTRGQTTPFNLETRAVSLSVTGASHEVQALMRTLDRDERVKHAQMIDLRATGRGSSQLKLELSLIYFGLSENRPAA